jgi:nucleoside-diphosphate-sugar epimerase
MYDLLEEVRAAATHPPRVVYASSIAVFGDPLPAGGVDDATTLAPRLVYGGHKAMMEVAVAMMSHRGEIDGVTVRLPGILARPQGAAGMKSAFMSDLFHALREGRPFVCPVSAGATIWAESVTCCAANLQHALTLDAASMPRTRAVTLPALRIRMDDLAAEIAHQCGSDPALVSYAPDAGLEAAFGAHPALSTPNAERAGFVSDGDVATLVARALARIGADAD